MRFQTHENETRPEEIYEDQSLSVLPGVEIDLTDFSKKVTWQE